MSVEPEGNSNIRVEITDAIVPNHGQVESISVLPAGIRISKKSPRQKAYKELKPGDHIAAGDIILLDVEDPWPSLITVTLS